MFVPGVELASCCWVSGICLSLLAGVGPPCSPWVPCWALCPDWLQLWFWLSGWLSALALLSSKKTMVVQNESKTNNDNIDSFHDGYANLLKGQFTPNKNKAYCIFLTYTQKYFTIMIILIVFNFRPQRGVQIIQSEWKNILLLSFSHRIFKGIVQHLGN